MKRHIRVVSFSAFVCVAFAVCTRSGEMRSGSMPRITAPDTALRSEKLITIPALTDPGNNAQVQSIAAAVRAETLDSNDFKKTAGDAQPVGGAYARVHPHKDAHKGQDLLANLDVDKAKVLGRIIASADVVLDGVTIPMDTTIWVVVRSGGTLYGIFVPTDPAKQATIKSLERTAHAGDAHEGAKSRWVVTDGLTLTTALGVWTTCDGEGCCCTGSSCDVSLE